MFKTATKWSNKADSLFEHDKRKRNAGGSNAMVDHQLDLSVQLEID